MRFLWDRISEMILGAGHQFIYLEAWREHDAREARHSRAHPRVFKLTRASTTISTEDLGIELMPLLPNRKEADAEIDTHDDP